MPLARTIPGLNLLLKAGVAPTLLLAFILAVLNYRAWQHEERKKLEHCPAEKAQCLKQVEK